MKLSELLKARQLQKIPPGWKNRDQLAAAEGYSSGESMSPIIRKAVRLGLLEERKYLVRWGDGTRLRPYYRRVK